MFNKLMTKYFHSMECRRQYKEANEMYSTNVTMVDQPRLL